jgi:hypothetical protein
MDFEGPSPSSQNHPSGPSKRPDEQSATLQSVSLICILVVLSSHLRLQLKSYDVLVSVTCATYRAPSRTHAHTQTTFRDLTMLTIPGEA